MEAHVPISARLEQMDGFISTTLISIDFNQMEHGRIRSKSETEPVQVGLKLKSSLNCQLRI
nr:MAG TPA: hypothetical protein [Caudoviricetes sp.]